MRRDAGDSGLALGGPELGGDLVGEGARLPLLGAGGEELEDLAADLPPREEGVVEAAGGRHVGAEAGGGRKGGCRGHSRPERARSCSRRASQAAIASRLSCSFLPRAIPSSSFA